MAGFRRGALKPGGEVGTVQGTTSGGLSTAGTSSPGMMRPVLCHGPLGTRAEGGLIGGKVGGGVVVSGQRGGGSDTRQQCRGEGDITTQ